jgi:deoxyribose-phosphate aldolase
LKTNQRIPASEVASRIDHTLLKPDVDKVMIKRLCEEADRYGFAAVCVPPCYVRQARDFLVESGVKVATVVGFPMGYQHTDVKFFEAHKALMHGAQEIDVVMNLTAFKSGHYDEVEGEVEQLSTLCEIKGAILKVIIETSLLTTAEIINACKICADAGATFVKTSTGFSGRGASVEDVLLMRQHLPLHIGIKASGGIRTMEEAIALIEAGANRIGCSSSIELMKNEHPT